MDRVNRGTATATVRDVRCKDCVREHAAQSLDPEAAKTNAAEHFEYNESWAQRVLDRGGSRTDRCARHRRLHKRAIQGLSVAYVDLATLGEAAVHDAERGPVGPLGGLGPLPTVHRQVNRHVNLAGFKFGMDDGHIAKILERLSDRRVLILKAGTGTGKSTFAPFRLLSPPDGLLRLADHGRIVVTEPRVQATIGVARYVGERLVMGCPLKECSNPEHGSFNPRAHIDDPARASGPSCDDEACQAPHVGAHPGPKLEDCVVSDCARHIGPGYQVGYQVAEDKNHDQACQLVYVTDGTMVNWLTEGRLNEIGTVIIDEAHERSSNIDFILAYLRRELDRYPHLRVIVTSATFDVEFYEDYFGSERVHCYTVPATKSFGYGAPLFASQGGADSFDCSCEPEVGPEGGEARMHGKLTTYEAWRDEHWPKEVVRDDGRVERLRDITDQLRGLRFNRELPSDAWKNGMAEAVADQIIRLASHLDNHNIYGDILAFLPTNALIKTAFQRVEATLSSDQADLFALIRSAPTDHQEEAIAERQPGERRKIVIATNMAETSLTVSGVRFVIDSGLATQQQWNVETVSKDVPTAPHSQAGIRQRWGRVGRDAPGWVFPLYTKSEFVKLPADTRPGSTRENLEQLSAKVMAAGIADVEGLNWPANHTFGLADTDAQLAAATFEQELARAGAALRSNGTVDSQDRLTSFGRELGRFGSHSAAFAVAVMCADQLACASEVITALLLLDSAEKPKRLDRFELKKLLLGRPPRDSGVADWHLQYERRRDGLRQGCQDDLDYVLRIVAAWERADPNTRPWEPSPRRAAFAADWWLAHDVLVAVAEARREVLSSLSSAMNEEVKRFVAVRLSGRARAAISRGYADFVHHRQADGTYRAERREDGVALGGGYRQFELSDQIMPLGQRDGSLTQIINFVPWAATQHDASSDGTFDLLLAVADHQDAEAGHDDGAEQWVSLATRFPLGRRVQPRLVPDRDSYFRIASVGGQLPAFARPNYPRSQVSGEVTGAGSRWEQIMDSEADTAWPTGRTATVKEADPRWVLVEPTAVEVDEVSGRPVSGEINDAHDSADGQIVDMLSTTPLPDVLVRVDHWPAQVGQLGWFSVDRYEQTGTGLCLVLVPDCSHPDFDGPLGSNDDLRLGMTAIVVVGPMLRVGRRAYRCLERADGFGRFLVRDNSLKPADSAENFHNPAGLAPGDNSVLEDLRPGVRLAAEVVPGPYGTRSVSLVRQFHNHLAVGAVSHLPGANDDTQRAVVTVPALKGATRAKDGRMANGRVVLLTVDAAVGVSYTFDFPPHLGARLCVDDLVTVQLDYRASELKYVTEDVALCELVASHVENVAAISTRLRVLPGTDPEQLELVVRVDGPLSPAEREILGGLCDDRLWVELIWSLYQRSFSRRVKSLARASGLGTLAELPVSPTTWLDEPESLKQSAIVRGEISDYDENGYWVAAGRNQWGYVPYGETWLDSHVAVGDWVIVRVLDNAPGAAAEFSAVSVYEIVVDMTAWWQSVVRQRGAELSARCRAELEPVAGGRLLLRWATEALAHRGYGELLRLFGLPRFVFKMPERSLHYLQETYGDLLRELSMCTGVWQCEVSVRHSGVVVLADTPEHLAELLTVVGRRCFNGCGWVDFVDPAQEHHFGADLAQLRSQAPVDRIWRQVGVTRWEFTAARVADAVAFLASTLARFAGASGRVEFAPLEVVEYQTGRPVSDFGAAFLPTPLFSFDLAVADATYDSAIAGDGLEKPSGTAAGSTVPSIGGGEHEEDEPSGSKQSDEPIAGVAAMEVAAAQNRIPPVTRRDESIDNTHLQIPMVASRPAAAVPDAAWSRPQSARVGAVPLLTHEATVRHGTDQPTTSGVAIGNRPGRLIDRRIDEPAVERARPGQAGRPRPRRQHRARRIWITACVALLLGLGVAVVSGNLDIASVIFSHAPARPDPGNSPDPDGQELAGILSRDRALVDQKLLGKWVSQLSSSPISSESAAVVDEYEAAENNYDVYLIRSTEFNFDVAYAASNVTISAQGFPDSQGALDWCRRHHLDDDHCLARLVTHDASIIDTEVRQTER